MIHRSRAGRSRRTVTALVAALAGVGSAASCSSSTNPAPLGDTDGSAVKPPPHAIGDGGDAKPADGAVVVPDAGSDSPLGTLATVDEPDTPCVPAGGATTVLFSGPDAGGVTPGIAELRMLGAGRFGSGDDVNGFVTFAIDGTSPRAFPIHLGAGLSPFSSEGQSIGGAGATSSSIFYQRYDAQGVASGSTQTLATGLTSPPLAMAIAGDGGGSLVAWVSGGRLHAAGVTSGGAPAGPAFDVGPADLSTTMSIAPTGTGFGIVWTNEPTSATTASRFALVTAAGVVGAPVTLTTSAVQFLVKRIVHTPTGFAVLALSALGDDHVYVVILDPSGNVAGPAHRLLGADFPWDIAAQGTELGVVIASNDMIVDGAEGPRRPFFRPLDAAGHALGPWVCLGAGLASNAVQDMAIDADGTGYAVVFQDPSADELLTRIGPLGK